MAKPLNSGAVETAPPHNDADSKGGGVSPSLPLVCIIFGVILLPQFTHRLPVFHIGRLRRNTYPHWVSCKYKRLYLKRTIPVLTRHNNLLSLIFHFWHQTIKRLAIRQAISPAIFTYNISNLDTL